MRKGCGAEPAACVKPGGAKPIIGLCGAIGSGKSTVAAEFARQGALVIDSDRLSHEILGRPEVLAVVRGWWGDEVVGAAGGPNRSRIAEIVFTDSEQKRRLESLLYPLIAAARDDMIRRGFEDPAVRAIILDSPLLLERDLDRQCDSLVFVEADEGLRLERLRRSRGWDAEQVARRSRWQYPPEQKRARADHVVVNEGTIDDLRAQVAEVIGKVLSHHAARQRRKARPGR